MGVSPHVMVPCDGPVSHPGCRSVFTHWLLRQAPIDMCDPELRNKRAQKIDESMHKFGLLLTPLSFQMTLIGPFIL